MKYLFLMLFVIGNVAPVSAKSIGESVDFFGDARLRHELLDEVGKNYRVRQRIRARFGLSGKVNEQIKFKLRLATGGTGITSTNQTLGDGFNNKDIALDQAYIDYDLTDGTSVLLGKMSIPFFRPGKSSLFWDGDVTPEGMALQYKTNNETINVFSSTGVFSFQERSSDTNAALYATQIGFAWTGLKVGLSAYIFGNLKGRDVISNSAKSFGNTVVNVGGATTQNQYVNDYQIYEFFLEHKFKIKNLPIRLALDYLVNGAIAEEDNAYLASIELGSVKSELLPLAISYNYRYMEKDGTLGVLSDSDVFNGGVDGEGHMVQVKYRVQKNFDLSITQFYSKQGIVAKNTFNRTMMDVGFKF